MYIDDQKVLIVSLIWLNDFWFWHWNHWTDFYEIRDFVCINYEFLIPTTTPVFTPLEHNFRDKNYPIPFLGSRTISVPNFIKIGSAVLTDRQIISLYINCYYEMNELNNDVQYIH